MARRYWLMKSEPFKYPWEALVKDGRTYWDGVRNYEARNNLAAMRCGDLALFYHSNEGKEVVGIAKVTRSAYPDPTSDDDRWLVVDLAPYKPLKAPVTTAPETSAPLASLTVIVTVTFQLCLLSVLTASRSLTDMLVVPPVPARAVMAFLARTRPLPK